MVTIYSFSSRKRMSHSPFVNHAVHSRPRAMVPCAAGWSCNVVSSSFNLVLLPAVSVLSFSTSKLLLICQLWWEGDLPSKPPLCPSPTDLPASGKEAYKENVWRSLQLSVHIPQLSTAQSWFLKPLRHVLSSAHVSVCIQRHDKVLAKILFILDMCMRCVHVVTVLWKNAW